MAISKRTRYEVLRRDSHTCRYCGASAPDVKLHVDHVTPTALGGTDDPSNLVAACVDCNNGKASTSPSEQTVAQVSDDAVRWAAAREVAIAEHRAERAIVDAAVLRVHDLWVGWDANLRYIGDRWESTVERWLREGLSAEEIEDCVLVAMGARVSVFKTWRYACGVARNRIADIDARMVMGGDS